MNYLNNKEYSNEYYNLEKKWKSLPVYKDKKKLKEFFELFEKNQVILLTSGTGSGKTVVIPKLILKHMIDNKIDGKIAITNPKVLTTKSNAEYGAKTLDVILGEEVGYKFKNSPPNSMTDKTKLIYLTDGTLMSIILNKDKLLNDYYTIIIDEAHERKIQIDMLLLLIKEIIPKRVNFKLIIMSATINAEVFRNYFDNSDIKYGEINIYNSTNLKVEHKWFDFKKDYIGNAVNIANSLLKNKEDMIVFVPTKKDTIKGCETITEQNKNLYCSEVYSKMTDENKELAISIDKYKNNKKFDMKIIFSTNVAESSITFDGLKHVIDTGLELVNNFDSKYNMYIIKKDFTTRAQVDQRVGRVGRTSTGTAYHLYTKEKYNLLDPYPKPSIITTDIIGHVLSMIKYYKTVDKFIKQSNEMITPPTMHQINNSLHKLDFNNFIKEKHEQKIISTLGIIVSRYRTDNLLLILAIVMGYYMNCQNEIIIIASIIEVTDGKVEMLFTTKNMKKLEKFKMKSYKNSDHLALLKVYKIYKENKLQYLKLDTFNKIDYQIKMFEKYTNKIYKYDKLKLIDIKPFDNINKNILYVLSKAHRYNIIKNDTTQNFINNSKGKIEFYNITNIDKDNSKKKFFCHKVINMFGKNLFQCVSEYIDE